MPNPRLVKRLAAARKLVFRRTWSSSFFTAASAAAASTTASPRPTRSRFSLSQRATSRWSSPNFWISRASSSCIAHGGTRKAGANRCEQARSDACLATTLPPAHPPALPSACIRAQPPSHAYALLRRLDGCLEGALVRTERCDHGRNLFRGVVLARHQLVAERLDRHHLLVVGVNRRLCAPPKRFTHTLATPCAHSAHAFCKVLRTRCSPSFLICTAIAATDVPASMPSTVSRRTRIQTVASACSSRKRANSAWSCSSFCLVSHASPSAARAATTASVWVGHEHSRKRQAR